MKKIWFVIFMLISYPCFSHPHVFVESEVEFIFDGNKNIKEVKQKWFFDEMTSASIINDNDINGNGRFDNDENIAISQFFSLNMGNFNFYTNIFINDNVFKINKVSKFLAKIEEDDIVSFQFYIPLAGNINPFSSKFDISLFDKSFFMNIEFKESPIKISGINPKECPCIKFKNTKHKIFYDTISPITIGVCRK